MVLEFEVYTDRKRDENKATSFSCGKSGCALMRTAKLHAGVHSSIEQIAKSNHVLGDKCESCGIEVCCVAMTPFFRRPIGYRLTNARRYELGRGRI